MPSVLDSSHRLVVRSRERGSDFADIIGDWLAQNDPDATFSVAELANPARDHGDPVLVIAIDAGHAADLERIRNWLAADEPCEVEFPPCHLHLATH